MYIFAGGNTPGEARKTLPGVAVFPAVAIEGRLMPLEGSAGFEPTICSCANRSVTNNHPY